MANHHHLTRAVEVFYGLDKHMTLFQMYCFLLVATNEGQTQNWFERKLDTSNAVTSRTLRKFSEFDKPGKPGLNLIETVIDPNDRRFRIVTLTPKGKALVASIRKKLGEPNGAN